MAEWYESFFDGLYTRVQSSEFGQAASLRHVRIIRRLLKARKGQQVLDIPCGMGRLTIPMAKSGLRMTGVDLTPEYIRRARRGARRARVNAEFLCSDMREIDFDEEFDAAFNWWGSFGYFSEADNLVFCRKTFRALKPGGRFLVEGPNKTRWLADFCQQVEYTTGGVRVAQRPRWNGRTNRVHTSWTLQRGRQTEHKAVSFRLYNGSEMRRLLRAAGFRDVRLFSGELGKPFTRHSRRLLAVGLKPRIGRTASRSGGAGRCQRRATFQ